MEDEGRITVLVVQAPQPRTVTELRVHLPAGSTVGDALREAHFPVPSIDEEGRTPGLSLWSRRVEPGHVLRDGDRVELTRDLRVDPKVARRERFASQGSRTTGLFRQKRPGAKAGY